MKFREITVVVIIFKYWKIIFGNQIFSSLHYILIYLFIHKLWRSWNSAHLPEGKNMLTCLNVCPQLIGSDPNLSQAVGMDPDY